MSDGKETDGAITIVQNGVAKFGTMAYIEEQIKLLAKFNLSPQSVERYEVVLRDGVRTLRKREHPIRFFIDQSKYDVPTCNTTLPSENFFRRKRPSRFNDEERTTAPTMIELKETFLG